MKTKKQISGIIMAVIGFCGIIFSAMNYILGWDLNTAAISIMGLVFVAIGMPMARGR
jgi:hypothetical protein